METTGLLSFTTALVYLASLMIAYLSSGDLDKTYKKVGLTLIYILATWGLLGTIAYMADRQCLPYSGALECYYEN